MIKALRVKRADFAWGGLKKSLYVVLNGICVVNSVFRRSYFLHWGSFLSALFQRHVAGVLMGNFMVNM